MRPYRTNGISAFFLVTLFMLISRYERNLLETEYYVVKSDKISQRVHFVFLSDLHEKSFGMDNERLLDALSRLDPQPDFVLTGGDFITSQKYHGIHKRGRDFVSTSCRLLDKLKKRYRVYFAFGNHEERLREKIILETAGGEHGDAVWKYRELEKSLEGIHVLDQSSAFLPEANVLISGVTLPLIYYRSLFLRKKKKLSRRALLHYTGDLKQQAPDHCFRLVLLHSPFYYREAIDYGADLVLCGHVHGGTIRIPGLGALMTPQYRFFFRECAGMFRYHGGTAIVNRGLGTHSVNIRINDHPEISVITLEPENRSN